MNAYQTVLGGVLALCGGLAVIAAAVLEIGFHAFTGERERRRERRARHFQAANDLYAGLGALRGAIDQLMTTSGNIDSATTADARTHALGLCQNQQIRLLENAISIAERSSGRIHDLTLGTSAVEGANILNHCAGTLEICTHRARYLQAHAVERFAAGHSLGAYTEPAKLLDMIDNCYPVIRAVYRYGGNAAHRRVKFAFDIARRKSGHPPDRQARPWATRFAWMYRKLLRHIGVLPIKRRP